MRSARLLLALGCVALVAASAAVPADRDPLMVAALPDRAGELRDVRIVDAGGHERGRLRLPRTPDVAVPVADGQVLYAASGHVFLADAVHRRVVPVAVPVSADVTIGDGSFTGGHRFKVLAHLGGGPVYLLDSRTHRVTRLGAPGPVFSGVFSPGERYLLAVGQTFSLVPTGSPSAAKALPDDLRPGGFSRDGRRLVLTSPRTAARVVVRDLDGSGSRSYRPRIAGPVVARFAGADSALLLGEKEAALLSLRDGSLRRLGSLPQPGLTAWIDPAVRGALVELVSSGSPRYVWLDLAHGRSRSLPLLAGFSPLQPEPGATHAFLVDRLDSGTGGRRIAVVDLAGGRVRVALQVPRAVLYVGSSVTADGEHLVAVTGTPKTTSAWLVDAASAKARAVATAPAVYPRFSPDGATLAVGEVLDRARPPRTRLLLVDVASGRARPAGQGFAPAWADG